MIQTCSPGVDRGTNRRREAPSCLAAHAIANPGQVLQGQVLQGQIELDKFLKVNFSTSIASAAPHEALGVAPLHGCADPSDLEAGNYDN